MPELLIVGDIGGTNTRVRLLDATDVATPLEEARYGDGQPVNQALSQFIGGIGPRRSQLRAACFGVAGRVVDGDVRMTNRPTETITDESLGEALGLAKDRVRVVNDMVGHMSGVDESETITLRQGTPEGNVEGIVMPGTGLGIGYAVRINGRRVAMPSEGGHLDFAPPNDRFDPLLRAARDAGGNGPDGRVSWEWLVCGPGLSRMYNILRGAPAEQPGVTPKRVTEAALGQPSDLDADLARQVTRMLVELCGARAGNLALDILASAGIYLGGNILNLLHDHDPAQFVDDFLRGLDRLGPEVLRDTMVNIPVHLIRSDDSGLRGAAVLARELL